MARDIKNVVEAYFLLQTVCDGHGSALSLQSPYQSLHLKSETAAAQRGEVTCPRS